MVKIKLRNVWFAPSFVYKADKLRVFSGKRFSSGVHDIPDELVKFLPKTAIILDKDYVEEKVEEPVVETLKDYDLARTAMDEVEKAIVKADKHRNG